MSLSLKNISKSFFNQGNSIEILKDINLCIEDGQMASLVGQSGAGKSTLLQIAGLLDQQTSGDIYIDNIKVFVDDEKKEQKLEKIK